MERIFAKVENGNIKVLKENGCWRNTIGVSGNVVSVQTNGDMIMATCKDGATMLFDKDGNYKGRA